MNNDHKRVIVHENRRNPVLPLSVHIPDGEAHVMPDGKLYVYGSLDAEEGRYCSERYVSVSTHDMQRWEISETSFDSSRVPWHGKPMGTTKEESIIPKNSPTLKALIKLEIRIACKHPIRCIRNINRNRRAKKDSKTYLFAPDAIYHNGKYYLYFCMSDNSEGVAVSHSPTGPFERPVQLACKGIDPAVFIDEDGQAYYYWGQFTANGAKLSADMLRIEEDSVCALLSEKKHFFHEGSSVRKRNGIYYFVFANAQRGRPTALGYATGTSPLGPFTYRGIIIDNIECDPFSWNNHGSIEEFNGQWYVFYHRSSRGDKFMRRLCIEPIFFNDDGSIDEVKMTSQGAGPPFGIHEQIMGYQTCGVKGDLFVAPYQDSEAVIGIKHKNSAVFRYFSSQKPVHDVDVAADGSGTVEFLFDGKLCGFAKIRKGKQIKSFLEAPSGSFEVTCRFLKPRGLKLKSFCFH